MAVRAACVFCGEPMPVDPSLGRDHWKTCEKHPARAEIEWLLDGLKTAARRFRFKDRDGDELWSDAAECIEDHYLRRWHDGTERL